ncbi:MAG: hypothetical protein M1138_00920 [Candidatus Thermoplasmatota archaeon]|nr:hypothetical protein [Candidatus Thermoplasmatota archaeon]
MSGQHIRVYTGKPVRRYLGIFTIAAYDRMYNQLKAAHPDLTQDQIRIGINEVLKEETEKCLKTVRAVLGGGGSEK